MRPPGSLLVFVFALTILATPASAWWNLWPTPPEPVEPEVLTQQTVAARGSECRAGDGVHTRFGATGFMRGTLDATGFSGKDRARLAAAHVAQSEAGVVQQLAPIRASENGDLRRTAVLLHANWVLTRPQWATSSVVDVSDWLGADDLVAHPDAAYLRAVIALGKRRWDDVRRHVTTVLEMEPAAYDAQVLLMLYRIRKIGLRPANCQQTIRQIQQAISPALQYGACPTHVAHLDLAIRRYIPNRRDQAENLTAMLGRVVLAYVARNDRECRRLLGDLEASRHGSDCAQVVQTFPCGD